MRKVKTTSDPMFSNGTEAMIWIGNNCDKCWKQSRYNKEKDKCIVTGKQIGRAHV